LEPAVQHTNRPACRREHAKDPDGRATNGAD
jgi:hypothetical protein